MKRVKYRHTLEIAHVQQHHPASGSTPTLCGGIAPLSYTAELDTLPVRRAAGIGIAGAGGGKGAQPPTPAIAALRGYNVSGSRLDDDGEEGDAEGGEGDDSEEHPEEQLDAELL